MNKLRAVGAIAGSLLALTAALQGCTPKAPRIADPARMVAWCGGGEARPTGVASVMTSTDDKLLPDKPRYDGIARETKAATGVIEFWPEQPLMLPRTSKLLGENDGYVRVRAVAVPLGVPGATTRRIYLDMRDHGFYRWVAMTAYDVQNVCVEGRREA